MSDTLTDAQKARLGLLQIVFRAQDEDDEDTETLAIALLTPSWDDDEEE